MPQILDRNDTNLFVLHDDGTDEIIPLSRMNRLLFDHDLWGVLRDGDEVLVFNAAGELPSAKLIPEADAERYILVVGDYEPLDLGPHLKQKVVDALADIYLTNGDRTHEPLVDLFDAIRAKEVRHHVMNHFASLPPFEGSVRVEADGWFIHDYLLLTWSGNFHHPHTETVTRSGSTVVPGASDEAYVLNFGEVPNESREVTFRGEGRVENYRLTDAEMRFLASALWAVGNAPVITK